MKKPTKMEFVVDDDFEPTSTDRLNIRLEGSIERIKDLMKGLKKAGFEYTTNKKFYKVPDTEPARYYRYLNNVIETVEDVDETDVVIDEDEE